MLRQFFFLCFLAAAAGQAATFNDLLDQLLDVLRPKIVEEGKDQLAVDSVNYDWSYKILFFTVYGSIGCSDGRARYLSTIKRTGDASGFIDTDGITVEASVGLEVMQFLFDTCSVSVKDVVTLRESVGGNIKSNSLTMKLHFYENKARIDSLVVNQLSGIELTTGTNILHQLENRVLNGVVQKFHDKILDSINHQLKQFQGKTIDIKLRL